MFKRCTAVLVLVLAYGNAAFAAHPLITDDTGTQGKGNMQFEFVGEYGKDREAGVTETVCEVPVIPVSSYGLSDSIDLVLSLPYNSMRTEEKGITSAVRGIGDAAIELKARVYEREGFSLAIKPGISLPTGDENMGLGNGKISYGAFLIATQDADPWSFHVNLGYARNEFKLKADEEANRKDIWHVSLASEMQVAKNLNLVANVGMERNRDKTSNTDPAFVLAGFIFSLTENLEVDMGIKAGLNKPETDHTYLAGLVWRLEHL